MEPLLVAIAAAQSGVFSRGQALATGYTDRRIHHLLTVGTWLRCYQGIFRLAGIPLTFDATAWIAVLAAGTDAVLSHRVAGKVYRLDGAPLPVHARVDFALPNIRLAIEADGYATHALRPGFERDREKAALLQLAGWSMLSFTATQIRQRPEWVIGVVCERVAQLSAANT